MTRMEQLDKLVDNFLNKIKEMEKNQTYDARTITHLMAIRWDFEATRAELLKLAGGDPDNDPIAKRVHDTFEKISHTNWGQLK